MTTIVCFDDILLESAQEVFETMIFMDMERSEDPDATLESDNIMGIITFSGAIEGSLGVCCGPTCAKVVTANMLGLEPEDEISQDDVTDAVGEIANMVLGCIKSRIHDSIGCIDVSVPSVVHGQNIQNDTRKGVSYNTIKVLIEDENIAEFRIAYRENKTA